MRGKSIYYYIGASLWILNPFLVFISLLKDQIKLGTFFTWFGKMHPLLLHFPIALSIFIGIYLIAFNQKRVDKDNEQKILLINAFLAVLVAILGIFLSKENSYEGTILIWHQWGGVGYSILSWIILFLNNKNERFNKSISLRSVLGMVYVLLIILFTHKGAQLTHGIDAVSFPSSKDNVVAPIVDSNLTIYQKAVQPILNDKCVSCHGPQKKKGDLLLHTPELIAKGGKDGSVFLLQGKSSIIERMHLPLTQEAHMPPDGKPQLSPSEILILEKWILAGGKFDTKLSDINKNDSLFQLANNYTPPSKNTTLNHFPDLKEYNTNYCNVHYTYGGGDKIEVSFYQGKFYDPAQFKKFDKIKEKIIFLNLQTMQLKKEDLVIVSSFPNLEKLNLNYTGIDFSLLEPLTALHKLNTLSICGINFSLDELNRFLQKSKIKNVYLWNNTISSSALNSVIKAHPGVQFIIGDNLQNEFIKLNNPSIDQDSSIIKEHLDINIKHGLKGTIIRYTLDGTEPDSLGSAIYTKPLRFTKSTIIKAKAFKTGWLSSDVIQKTLYHSTIHPDTVFLLTHPDKKYIGTGARTLFDYEIGEKNFGNGKWLGYKDANMELVFGFKKKTSIKEAYVNALVNMGSYIFPIVSIRIYGSNDGKNYTILNTTSFPTLHKDSPANINETQSFYCPIKKPTPFLYYKMVVQNLKKLPEWHPGKGTPAWIFMDELFLN